MIAKVLIVGPIPPPMGGIATYVEDLLKSRISDEFTVLHLNTARSIETKKYLVKNLLLCSKNILKLMYLLFTKKPQIVHVHTSSYFAFWEKSIFIIISKLFFAKIIIHVHGGGFQNFYNSQPKLLKLLVKTILNTSNKIFVLSEKWDQFFLTIVRPNKTCIMYNCVFSELYQSSQEETFHNTKINIFFAGYLSKEKGVYDILKAIPLVAKKHPQVQFTFAGAEHKDGELENIKKEISSTSIGCFIKFEGVLTKEEMILIYKKSDIFILPSYVEGLPMTLLEAMATGLPIISTHVGGIPEIITEGENGFLIEPGDYVGMANRIIELIEQPKLRFTFGFNNAEKIKEMYSWEVIADRISLEYKKLLDIK